MKLESYLDHELKKETSDVVFIDELGNDITSAVPGDAYDSYEVLSVRYDLIAVITIK